VSAAGAQDDFHAPAEGVTAAEAGQALETAAASGVRFIEAAAQGVELCQLGVDDDEVLPIEGGVGNPRRLFEDPGSRLGPACAMEMDSQPAPEAHSFAGGEKAKRLAMERVQQRDAFLMVADLLHERAQLFEEVELPSGIRLPGKDLLQEADRPLVATGAAQKPDGAEGFAGTGRLPAPPEEMAREVLCFARASTRLPGEETGQPAVKAARFFGWSLTRQDLCRAGSAELVATGGPLPSGGHQFLEFEPP